MRKVTDSDLVGKTIKAIDSHAVNVVRLYFTDDTVLDLYAEEAINTIAGPIPGIFTDDSLLKEQSGEMPNVHPLVTRPIIP